MSLFSNSGPTVPYGEDWTPAEGVVSEDDYNAVARGVDSDSSPIVPVVRHCAGGYEPLDVSMLFGEDEYYQAHAESDKIENSNESSHAFRTSGDSPPPAPTGYHFVDSGERRNGFVVWHMKEDEPPIEV